MVFAQKAYWNGFGYHIPRECAVKSQEV